MFEFCKGYLKNETRSWGVKKLTRINLNNLSVGFIYELIKNRAEVVVWQCITGDRLAMKVFGYKLQFYYCMDIQILILKTVCYNSTIRLSAPQGGT